MLDTLIQIGIENRRLIAGSVAALFLFGLATLLFWQERALRRRLSDLLPERRLPHLLKQWQIRNYQTIAAAMAVAMLGLYALPSPPAAVVPQAEQEAPLPDAPPPTDAPVADPSAVLDLFETGELRPSELTLDALKTRHENALIGGYILERCGRATGAEIEILLGAIRTDILHYQQDPANPLIDAAQLYANIVSAAKGSYEMVYGRADCDSDQVTMLQEQFANYVMRVRGAS